MKIIACIAEYNPLHLGHRKHFEYMKKVLNADKIIVLMSGNFSQRGEPTILNKFLRAKHAIIAGADLVIELPTVFATSNAENFAFGACSIIDKLGCVDGLCFGVESGDKQSYIDLASRMNNETKEFKKLLKTHLDTGISLAKAKFLTVKQLYGESYDEKLISSPNNILGLEYTKALLKLNSSIEICPMIRSGNHNDKTLKKGVTSATSIRRYVKAKKVKKIKGNVPRFVYKDLKNYPYDFDKMIMSKLITTSCEILKTRPDCTEGLENRIKALAKDNKTVDALIDKVITKRYTETRIRRILISNLLGITSDLLDDAKKGPFYAKILAVDSKNKDLISLISEKGDLTVLTRKSDVLKLKNSATKIYEKDVLANDLYNLATDDNKNENYMIII